MITLIIGLPQAVTFGERFALIIGAAFFEAIEVIILASFVHIALDTATDNPNISIIGTVISAILSVICWLVALDRSR